MEDTYLHKGMRKKLVAAIRKNFSESAQKGRISFLIDERVYDAMEKVPRHIFFDPALIGFAYDDKPFPIGAGQTISQPYTVAFQTMLLNLHSGDKVLEIGTGSGYQTCILLEMGVKVFTIERQRELYIKSQVILKKMNYNPKFFFGDGYKGLPSYAPFDRVLVTAGAPYVPEALIQQLKPGGILVIPVGKSHDQVMTSITKISENDYRVDEHGRFSFVPMVEDKK